jgi:hypothetical protein
VVGCRQLKTTGETLHEIIVVRYYAQANNGVLAGNNPVLDPGCTDNDVGMKIGAEEKKLHQMAKVNDFLEMWQGSKPYKQQRKNLQLKINR